PPRPRSSTSATRDPRHEGVLPQIRQNPSPDLRTSGGWQNSIARGPHRALVPSLAASIRCSDGAARRGDATLGGTLLPGLYRHRQAGAGRSVADFSRPEDSAERAPSLIASLGTRPLAGLSRCSSRKRGG